MRKIEIYDTTLRDGAQMEGISFSLEDKIDIVKKLDRLGIHYIEGGWPGSNPKDIRFFEKVKGIPLKHAKITVFGSTKRAENKVEEDENIQAILNSGVRAATIFGKSWDLHVKEVLKISLDKNLDLIRESIHYLRSKGLEVIYDAEHFFDGCRDNLAYSLATIRAASEAGAETIVLCDTNGGTMPPKLQEVIEMVRGEIDTPLGIHTHNDAGVAVANSIIAVTMGCNHVQGTINGYGERCGNADLCVVIPNLQLKLDIPCLSDFQLEKLTETSRHISEVANLAPRLHQPYVGYSAFAHKGGIHVDAVQKNPATYEHIRPDKVGNQRRILISELSGKSSILSKAEEYGLDLTQDTEKTKQILYRLKELEHEGYQFEAADASFELLIKKNTGAYRRFFDLLGFRVIVEQREDNKLTSEATVKLQVNGETEYTVAEGDGPVDALDKALRKALENFYPILRSIHLTDFKVRVLDAKEGTAAKVRVLIESSGLDSTWGTVGVSENIIEASYQALIDSIEYVLLKKEIEEKWLKH